MGIKYKIKTYLEAHRSVTVSGDIILNKELMTEEQIQMLGNFAKEIAEFFGFDSIELEKVIYTAEKSFPEREEKIN